MNRWSVSFTDVPMPGAAIEIASTRVSAAILGSRGLSAAASEPLPEGAVVPSLTAVNVKDREAVRSALQRVLDKVGRPRRAGLVVPDPVAKVSLIRLQQTPARADELDRLIRFQVRKAAPFAIDDAQVSYVPGNRTADGIDYLVTVARRDIVGEYESVCDALAVHTGIVDIQTFNVVNAALAGHRQAPGDWLLVNVAPEWASVVVGRGDDVILYRSRGADAEGTLVDLVHQTSMYYEDRLSGSGFERVLVSGVPAAGTPGASLDGLRTELSERLGIDVAAVDPGSATDLSAAGSGSRSAEFTALVGLLLRDRKVAA